MYARCGPASEGTMMGKPPWRPPGAEGSEEGDREFWIFDSETGWTYVRNPEPDKAVMDYGPKVSHGRRRYKIITTWVSADGQERVHIVQRPDGIFQFAHENWFRNVWEGQLIAEGWRSLSFSHGLFADAKTAETEAALEYGWLSSARRQKVM